MTLDFRVTPDGVGIYSGDRKVGEIYDPGVAAEVSEMVRIHPFLKTITTETMRIIMDLKRLGILDQLPTLETFVIEANTVIELIGKSEAKKKEKVFS